MERSKWKLTALFGAMVLAVFGGATKAQAADGAKDCYLFTTSTTFVDSSGAPTTSSSPYGVVSQFQFSCLPFNTTVTIGATNKGTIIGDLQGEVVNDSITSVTVGYGLNNDESNPMTTFTTFFRCRDNLAAHKQSVYMGGENWTEQEDFVNGGTGGSDGVWSEYAPPHHNGSYYKRRCGLV